MNTVAKTKSTIRGGRLSYTVLLKVTYRVFISKFSTSNNNNNDIRKISENMPNGISEVTTFSAKIVSPT